MTVTVSMPFHGAHEWFRGAVESILAQTYADWRLVIVNDADEVPPWPLIADLDDPRIIRFDLPVNRGRYFADAVILEAMQPGLWAMQDPDDWADPSRFERMVPLAEKYGAAFAPSWLYDHDAPVKVISDGLQAMPKRDRIRHMVGYGSGVVAGDRLVGLGGFHAGLRVGYDTWMMNALKLGRWVAIDQPLQNKRLRPGSLRTSPETGDRSAYRAEVRASLNRLWHKVWDLHAAGRPYAGVVPADTQPKLRAEVLIQADRLRTAAYDMEAIAWRHP